MAIFDTVQSLFGWTFKKDEQKPTDSGALSVGINDDGSAIAIASSMAVGLSIDIDGLLQSEFASIQRYREISLYNEVDSALQDIVNEAFPMETDTKIMTLNLDDTELTDKMKKVITDEFNALLKLLNIKKLGADIFRRWYVDGRIYFQIIIDKEDQKKGIKKLIPIDALKIKKVKEISKKRLPSGAAVIDNITEYFIYSEAGFATKTAPTPVGSQTDNNQNQNLKIASDAILYCPSGFVDQTSGFTISYLHKAIRPINQLRMLEDATVVYFIARAPERRVIYIDVGNMPKLKAEQQIQEIMNRYRNKIVYDPHDGSIKDDKKYKSMLEDIWVPRTSSGRTTEIQTLPGAQNVSGYLDSLEWFRDKMYDALNVPKSRFQTDSGFSLGRTSEITRDELKFQKFIDKLRSNFSTLFFDGLKTQLLLKQICNEDEWESFKDDIKIVYQSDNFFDEFKEQDLLTSRLELLQQADQYVGKYLSYKWIQKNVLNMDDDEIERMKEELDEEESDERAQPMWKQQMDAQMDQQEEMAQDQQAIQQSAGMQQQEQGQPATSSPNQAGNPSSQSDEEEYNPSNYK